MQFVERAKRIEQAYDRLQKVLDRYELVEEEYEDIIEKDELELICNLLEQAIED